VLLGHERHIAGGIGLFLVECCDMSPSDGNDQAGIRALRHRSNTRLAGFFAAEPTA
jgi:hypothetical protein